MKECPICHAVYNDNLNFCVKDGHQLKNVSTSHIEISTPDNNQGGHLPKKKGCLKKILVGGIIVVIGLIVFYNYLINAATYLRTEPNEIHVSKSGGSCKVDIDYDGYIWKVNHQPDWVDVEEFDNEFMLSVVPNQTGQIREGSITIQSGKLLSQVLVKQNAYATRIKTSENTIKFRRRGEGRDITIESDGCGWDAEYPDWLTITKESETELNIACSYNDGEYRTGTITVKEDNVRATISVSQCGDCNNCHGSGEVSCNSCFGSGSVGYGMFNSSCLWCGGNGKFKCSLCGGSGERE